MKVSAVKNKNCRSYHNGNKQLNNKVKSNPKNSRENVANAERVMCQNALHLSWLE